MNFLRDVPEDKAFGFEGGNIRNLQQLRDVLMHCSDGQFKHYVGQEHNYFADWVQHVIEDHKLAKDLRKTTDRNRTVEIISKRIHNLTTDHTVKVEAKKEKKPKSFTVRDKQKPKEEVETSSDVPKEDHEQMKDLLTHIAHDEEEIKEFLWKHFAWDMAKEFMYGLAIGILAGFILSRLFLP